MTVALPSGRHWPHALAAAGGPNGSQNNKKTRWTLQLCMLVDVWSQACCFISLLTRAESLSHCSSDAGDDWFFYSLFSTHLKHDWLLTPFPYHLWQSETLAHNYTHFTQSDPHAHTYSLKEWVRCLSWIANWRVSFITNESIVYTCLLLFSTNEPNELMF